MELIPPGFHDETDPKLDAYPVIADDMDLLYIEEDYRQGVAADQNARYRLVLKDGEMDCKALGEIASICPVDGALSSSNDFEVIYGKAIQHCMDKGATQSQILKLVDSKAPMAVWEKAGQYAIRTVGEVNRERQSEKANSAGVSR